MEQQLILYETSEGKIPFQQWLDNLRDHKAVSMIRAKLNKVRQGHFGDCKHLTDGVWEFRIHYAKGYRIYFAKYRRNYVLLLWGGIKKTQRKDIYYAVNFWKMCKEEINDGC